MFSPTIIISLVGGFTKNLLSQPPPQILLNKLQDRRLQMTRVRTPMCHHPSFKNTRPVKRPNARWLPLPLGRTTKAITTTEDFHSAVTAFEGAGLAPRVRPGGRWRSLLWKRGKEGTVSSDFWGLRSAVTLWKASRMILFVNLYIVNLPFWGS